MKSWGRFIIIFVAYGITLLHTAVPHHHLQAGNGEQVLIHHGCGLPHSQGGLLQRVFATDLGIGHLETFRQSSDRQLQLSFEAESVATLLPRLNLPERFEIPSTFLKGTIEKLKRQQLLSSSTSFRGPPAL